MTKAKQFRDRAQAHFGSKRRTRYPDDLRRLAMEHADAVGHLGRAAAELGLDRNTLLEWRRRQREPSTQPQLKPVRIVDEHRYVVEAPAGLRIEWPSAQAVAALVRALA